jgi:hypothetical protein
VVECTRQLVNMAGGSADYAIAVNIDATAHGLFEEVEK